MEKTNEEKDRELINKLHKAANKIHQHKLAGPANYIVTSGIVAESIQDAMDDIDAKEKIKKRDKIIKKILKDI